MLKLYRILFPYRAWIKLRNNSKDEYGEKLCYCGHCYKCSCSNPDKGCFKQNIHCKNIILWDENNGWHITKNNKYE